MQIYSENNYKQKTDEWDFIKIKYTFSLKDIVKKMKRHNFERIFTIHEQIFTIQKGYIQNIWKAPTTQQ